MISFIVIFSLFGLKSNPQYLQVCVCSYTFNSSKILMHKVSRRSVYQENAVQTKGRQFNTTGFVVFLKLKNCFLFFVFFGYTTQHEVAEIAKLGEC